MSAEESSPPPGRSKNITPRSIMGTGEASFRGLLSSLSRTPDRTANGPAMLRTAYDYLSDEMRSARQAVMELDDAVSKAVSFREAASKLREEAHRAMGRLETVVAAQVVESAHVHPDLINIACDIACAAKRGITLVDVYGKYSPMVKIMTVFLRSYIHAKFEKQTELLKKLKPPALRSQVPSPAVAAPAQPTQTPGCTTLLSPSSTAPGCGGSSPAPLGAAADVAVAAVAPLGRSSCGVAVAAAPPPPPPPASGAAAQSLGKLLQSNRHEKVLALAYVPPPLLAAQIQVQSSESVCIWWSVGQRLEHYSEATQSTTAFPEACSVTALGVDEGRSVWTGHAKGQVRVRYKLQWERTVESKAFTTAVRTIAFDEAGRAWVGDEAGRIKVLAYEPEEGQLETVGSLQRSPALLAKMKAAAPGSLFGKKYCNNSQAAAAASGAAAAATATAAGRDTSPGAAAVVAAAAGGGGGSTGGNNGAGGPQSHSAPSGTMEGPVRCIFVRGERAWAGGGRSCAWLQMWDTETLQDLDVFDCGAFGPCHAIVPMRWPSSRSSVASNASTPFLQPPTTSTTIAQHRHTHSDMQQSAVAAATASGSGSCCWRLLSGHENGQILLWHPEHRSLAPLLRIGDMGSPCRGIAVLDSYNLVVTGHQGGQLHLFRQPATEGGLPPGADSVSPQSLGTHRPKMVAMTAHKTRLERMAWGATSCVTVSVLGTIRLWHAAELAAAAQRMGLVFTHTPSYASLQMADGAQVGAPHYQSTSSNMHPRVSARSLGTEIPQGMSAGGLSSLSSSAAACGMSPAQSGLLLQPASVGGGAYNHVRQSSKDSMDTASTSTAAATEAVGGPTHIHTAAPASFPHFQTIDYTELQVQRKIGSGAYGEVLLAEWMGSEVAVKKLFAVHTMDDSEYHALMHEVTLLGSLSHPNILRFLAMCVEPPCIVMQYYPHGSLFDLLLKANRGIPKAAKELSWSKRLDMLRDVASGMQYLHSRRPPIIHGDLRSPNLLLDLTIDRERPRFHLKIADFGLARMATGATGSVMVSKMTNPRWLAPEVIRNSSVGKAADVYSFAIIMWEMLTWRQPFQDMMSVQVMFSTVTENFRPEVPPDSELPGGPGVSLPLYRQLMESCWQAEAAQRPSFKEIVEVFQNMQRVEGESARQQRQQQQQQQHQQVPRLGSPGDMGGHVASPPAAGSAEFAGTSTSAPSSGCNGSGSVPSASAAAAAATVHRVAAVGITSPFLCPTVPTVVAAVVDLQADTSGGGAITPDTGGNATHGQQQYGKVIPYYGMSSILEEASSLTMSALQPAAERGTAPSMAAGISPAPAVGGTAAAISPPPPPPPVLPHVGIAPASPFSQSVAESVSATAASKTASTSCPASPAPSAPTAAVATATGTGLAPPRGSTVPNPIPLSSASSAESGIVHAGSVGSNIAGAPSTAASSCQSSASNSGRAAPAALAASTAVTGRSGGPAFSTSGVNAQGVVGAAATTSAVSVKSPPGEAADAAGEGPPPADAKAADTAASGDLWSLYSPPLVPAPRPTCVSPFALLPPAQVTELGAAAPHLAAVVGENPLGAVAAAVPAVGHARTTAPPSPRTLGTPRSRGTTGSTGDRNAGHHAGQHTPTSPMTSAVAAATAMPSTARCRISGTPVGHSPPPRARGTGSSTPLGTPRSGGGGASSQSHFGTPPHRGPATASPASHSSVTHGGRQGFIAGGGPNPGQSPGGDVPSSGSRHPGSCSAGFTDISDAVPRIVAVSVQAHASEAAGRQSRSAAHSHLDSHDDPVVAGHFPRPDCRRAPSGDSPGCNRRRGAGGHEGEATAAPHPRTPPSTARGTGPSASSRVSAPNAVPAATGSRATSAARQNFPGPAGAGGAADIAGNPSASSSAHISRLAMAARPPGSPRTYIPSGPGSTSLHASSALISGGTGMSRIPSVLQAATHGSVQPVPAKSCTSRSLDDDNLRRVGMCHQAVGSPLVAAVEASAVPEVLFPAGGHAASHNGGGGGPFAVAVTSTWEEGLDGIQHSPDITQEAPLHNSDYGGGDATAEPEVRRQSGGEAEGVPYGSLPLLPRIATSKRHEASTAAAPAWQPPPLLAAAVVGGNSPFAVAAYACPFFPGEGEAEAGAEAGVAAGSRPEAAEAAPGGGLNCSGSEMRVESGVPVAATSPVGTSGRQMQSAWSNDSAVPAAAPAASTAPEARVRMSAAAPQSPFAQFATDQDNWWHDQHHDD